MNASAKSAITSVVAGLITYIVATQLITSMVTGTGTGDNLIRAVAPLVLAVAVVLVILKTMD